MAFNKLSTYDFPIYVYITPELTRVQNFLQRCFKRQYIYYQIYTPVYDFLEEADHALFKKISSMPGHLCILPSPTQKKVLCALEIQAAILIGLIPHAFKTVLSIQRSMQFNVKRVFNGNINILYGI